MKRGWVYRRMFDADIELTREQEKEAERRMVVQGSQRKVIPFVALAGVVGSFFVMFYGTKLGTSFFMHFGTPRVASVITSSIVLLVLHTSIYLAIFWWLYIRPMRRALREMGIEVCESCGYWLGNLPDDSVHCPECGSDRQEMAEQPERQDIST